MAKKIGVFVDKDFELIMNTIKEYQLKAVQLHGKESPELCRKLLKSDLEVIKAFAVDDDFEPSVLSDYSDSCSYFLFDTKTHKHGGSGKKFNWDILQSLDYSLPFFLSGGIGPEDANAIRSLRLNNLIGIDLNSRFEDAPAIKNFDKLSAFIKEIKPMKYKINEEGYYGSYGGAFIPELLYQNIQELKENYLKIMESDSFQDEFIRLLKEYVGRPSPLYFSKALSEKYGAQIFLKREDLNHTGSHKINNTIGQILLAKSLGKKRIIAETGAGQHGVATATVCAREGLECVVFMGALDVERQQPNVQKMQMLGAKVVPVESGNKTLKDATNEAIRDWINHPEETYYLIGSVVGPHPYPDMVSRFQSVISEEIKNQLKQQTGNVNSDKIIACVGGGSNAIGAYYHFLDDENVKLIAVEADGLGLETGETAATTAAGSPGIIHGSKTILMQTDDGQIVEPYSISAGLDYPGIGPVHAHLFETGRVEFIRATDDEALKAAFELTALEGIIPALETAHALAALPKLEFKEDELVVINISGRGDKDMATYQKYIESLKHPYQPPKMLTQAEHEDVNGLFIP